MASVEIPPDSAAEIKARVKAARERIERSIAELERDVTAAARVIAANLAHPIRTGRTVGAYGDMIMEHVRNSESRMISIEHRLAVQRRVLAQLPILEEGFLAENAQERAKWNARQAERDAEEKSRLESVVRETVLRLRNGSGASEHDLSVLDSAAKHRLLDPYLKNRAAETAAKCREYAVKLRSVWPSFGEF